MEKAADQIDAVTIQQIQFLNYNTTTTTTALTFSINKKYINEKQISAKEIDYLANHNTADHRGLYQYS